MAASKTDSFNRPEAPAGEMMEDQRQGWRDVRDVIRDWVLTGRYAAGDRLPRDVDIAAELNCARSTVLRAMQDLSDAGMVERRRKGGTRVRPDPIVRATLDIPITRREVEAKGGRYGYQLVKREVVAAPRAILAATNVADPRDMLHVEAIHLSDGQPYIFEDRWICLETAPEILGIDLSRKSANEWLVLNKPYSRFDVRLYAIMADAGMADLMAVAEGAALLVIERTTWIDEAPITTVRSVTRPGYQLATQS
ncbi:GntR family transcriptional regulator [Pseudooceanicola sp. C21-150M6]|uniref:GntR family transcriptional regulator n=1 Tax=Pseudooceanicola sp. C21-150M6 TaxID=3434355 RepID=UPI003D7FC9AB